MCTTSRDIKCYFSTVVSEEPVRVVTILDYDVAYSSKRTKQLKSQKTGHIIFEKFHLSIYKYDMASKHAYQGRIYRFAG